MAGLRNGSARLCLCHGEPEKWNHLHWRTSDLPQRAWQHREGVIDGFTKEYGCKLLVWFEAFDSIHDARQFEARMKKWNRAWKINRIEERNPEWIDLFETLV